MTVYRLRSKCTVGSGLHSGRKLEVGDTNVVITAIQENVGLRGRGAQRGRLVMRRD